MSGYRHALPWQEGPLKYWLICGMNHYHVDGIKHLFVSMTKDGVCIKEEGVDTVHLWDRLIEKAKA